MSFAVAIGIDLGGTNLKVAAVDSTGRVLSSAQTATNPARGPEIVLAEMVDLSDRLLTQLNRTRAALIGVGVGAPGPLNQTAGTVVRAANLVGWNDVPIRDFLHKSLHVLVHLENDANAAAYGEFWVGDPKNRTDLVLLTLGTGVGAGIILGGQVLRGHFENAGELGHMIVNPEGPLCACGQRGCLEQYASGTSVTQRAQSELRGGEPSTLRQILHTQGTLNASDVSRCAQQSDPLSMRIWLETCMYLALACINIQHAFNPARIILGGGLSQAGEFLLHSVQNEFKNRFWKLGHDVPAIGLARLGYDAGAIGAAGLAWKNCTAGT
ncbi:MAG: ROK family protein [Planctomycetota bacterium]